jgi:hypothetical protein
MYPEDGTTENKILDLTSQESDDDGLTYICDHCEIELRKCDDDLVSANNKNVIAVIQQGAT